MFTRVFLGVCGIVFVAGICCLGFAVIQNGRKESKWQIFGDLALGLALVPVALFAIYPYLGVNLVGAGDAYHYGLQVADFVTQARQGVMPVLVGQSAFGFNGNIHTLRTAPYYTHLAGLWDFLTSHRLSFVALQNLTVVTTSLLAVWAAFGACLVLTGKRRIASWLLAIVYVLSPAIVGPLALNDMFATYMAAPWLILCWSGLAKILASENDLRPQFVAAGGLALAWYAHSPIAAWLSMVWATMQVLKTFMGGGNPTHWLRLLATGLLLGGLLAYVFASLGSIVSGVSAPMNPAFFNSTWDDFRIFLRTEFIPFVSSSHAGGIQLGWTLWVLLLAVAGWALWFRHRVGLIFLATIGILLAFLIRVPGLSDFFWRRVPVQLVLMTNWPNQRLCPILAAGIIVAVATALRTLDGKSRAFYWTCCSLLLAGCVWSVVEVSTINRRPGFAQLPPTNHEPWFSEENIHLTHSAYDWLGELPGYFTHGWADPEFESRLLNTDREVAQSNAAAVLAAGEPGPAISIVRAATITLPGHAEYLLVFAFADPAAKGEITINGGGIQRAYYLPRSGNILAFGSDPAGGKTIPVRLRQAGIQTLTIGATIPGVSFRVVPVRREILPVCLDRLVPYTASVTATASGFLETPRALISGYVASVNGRASPIRRSPNGLAMIPVPAGKSQVVLTYPGSFALRTGWFVSIACFAAFPWFLAKAGSKASSDSNESVGWIRQNNLLVGTYRCCRYHRKALLTTIAVIGVVFGLTYGIRQIVRSYLSYGPVRITFDPSGKLLPAPEPLLTLGETGAADCIYLKYEGLHTVRFGLDHWAYGGPLTEPITITYDQPHVLEIDIGGLYPASRLFGRKSLKLQGKSGFGPLILKLDGKVIMDQQVPFYPVTSKNVYIGSNPTGSSVTNNRFSGVILSAERLPPPVRLETK